MCPHEILTVKGYALEDYFGEDWTEKYQDCVQDERIQKRVIPIKDIIRLIINSAVETGTPFTFNRDTVNRANPNSHKGIIYCSNLCTEIAQNMREIEQVEQTIKTSMARRLSLRSRATWSKFVALTWPALSLGRVDSR